MKHIIPALTESEIEEGGYYFEIVKTNVLYQYNRLQVVFKLSDRDRYDDDMYLLQEYDIHIYDCDSDYYKLVSQALTPTEYNLAVELDTDRIVDTSGDCEVIKGKNGQAIIDIDSMDFTATNMGEIDFNIWKRY